MRSSPRLQPLDERFGAGDRALAREIPAHERGRLIVDRLHRANPWSDLRNGPLILLQGQNDREGSITAADRALEIRATVPAHDDDLLKARPVSRQRSGHHRNRTPDLLEPCAE